MTLTIRRLGAGDESVLALLAAEAPEFDLAGRSSPELPLSPEAAAAYLSDPSVLHWAAEEDPRIVGELLCHLLRLPSRHGRELLLYSIGVRASDRRRGVGSALVAEMLRWMRSKGVPEVWVLADNSGAEAFYAACGFERGGEHDQGVLMLLNPTQAA
jgi:ribosomal protein S18 acetylase RimI-like enzyme